MVSRVISIDGPSASGKSSVAAGVATALGFPNVSTGSMYRAVALVAMRRGLNAGNVSGSKLEPVLAELELGYVDSADGFKLCVNGEFPDAELRTEEVAAFTSVIAALPELREWMRDRQRKLAGRGWLVMEGRDIGTEIFPDAAMKFFLTATAEERARRRLAQGEGGGSSLEEIAQAIAERDYKDSTRKISPLKAAADARIIDSTGNTFEETVGAILSMIRHHDTLYRVSYGDTDQMGVVYYANYLELFERGRTEMLRSVGLSYRELEEMGVFLPVSKVGVNYLASAHYDDLLTIRTQVVSAKGARLLIASEILAGEKILVRGEVTLGCVDGERKLRRLPQELVDACAVYRREGE